MFPTVCDRDAIGEATDAGQDPLQHPTGHGALGDVGPELTAGRLLGVGDVARLAGVTPATVTAYLSRRRMPARVTRVGNSPVRTRPVIQQRLASRPGQGVRGRR